MVYPEFADWDIDLLKYSYKNCYGLSIFFTSPSLKSFLYSYKNCYGLSVDARMKRMREIAYSYKNCYGLSQTELTKDFFVDGYSYKNCYGLSCDNSRNWSWCDCIRTRIVMVYRRIKAKIFKQNYVFVQELLWFIQALLFNLITDIEYSYKNCYGLSKAQEVAYKIEQQY